MSQENVEMVRGVRIPLAVRETRRRRTLDERIMVRFPALGRWLGAAWARLPRHSRLRRAILMRRLRQGYAAWNRRDFDVVILGFHPEVELRMAHLLPDTTGAFHGHAGVREVGRQIASAFEDFRMAPERVLDLGDRLIITTQLSGHGAGSGVSVSDRIHQVITLRQGSVIYQHDFLDHAEALEAVGLSE